MTTQTSTASGSKSTLGNVMAVVLVIWLLFFGGFSTLKTWLTPARLSQAGEIANTIKTGVGRVTSGSGAPVAAPRASSGAPIAPAQPASNQAAVDSAYQATVQAVNAAQSPAQPVAPSVPQNTLPTAYIAVPTAIPIEHITVIPRGMPQLATAALLPPTAIPAVTSLPQSVYETPTPIFSQGAAAIGPAECNSQNATFRSEKDVTFVDGKGAVVGPIGHVAAWSCTSADDAAQKVQAAEVEMVNAYIAKYGN